MTELERRGAVTADAGGEKPKIRNEALLKDLVFYSAIWCGPCKVVKEVVEELGLKDIVADVDEGDNRKNCERDGSSGIPYLFHKGLQRGMREGRDIAAYLRRKFDPRPEYVAADEPYVKGEKQENFTIKTKAEQEKEKQK